MTNELEKTFFDTFGIEPEYTYLVTDTFYTNNIHTYTATKDDLIDYFEGKNCGRYKVIEVYKNYPQITDHILLELLVIMTRYTDIIDGFDNVQELKEFVLKELIYSLTQQECDIVKHQVRTLFEEM